ncbi:MAG: GTP-binding protein, partial [Chitinophagaceae bacterium]
AIRAMDEADVCMLLLDAEKGITQQDLNIYGLATKKGKGMVVLVNKWDTIAKETNTARDYERELKQRLAPFNDVPIIFISATEKLRIMQAIESAIKVYDNRQRKVPTARLNEVVQQAIQAFHPPVVRGVPVSIKYATQLPTAVASFAFFCNHPDDVKQPYRNYLENQLRKGFDFKGVPIRLFFRKK